MGYIFPVVLYQGECVLIAFKNGIAYFIKKRFIDSICGDGRHQVLLFQNSVCGFTLQKRMQNPNLTGS